MVPKVWFCAFSSQSPFSISYLRWFSQSSWLDYVALTLPPRQEQRTQLTLSHFILSTLGLVDHLVGCSLFVKSDRVKNLRSVRWGGILGFVEEGEDVSSVLFRQQPGWVKCWIQPQKNPSWLIRKIRIWFTEIPRFLEVQIRVLPGPAEVY